MNHESAQESTSSTEWGHGVSREEFNASLQRIEVCEKALEKVIEMTKELAEKLALQGAEATVLNNLVHEIKFISGGDAAVDQYMQFEKDKPAFDTPLTPGDIAAAIEKRKRRDMRFNK
jgi:hypothetical protein